MPSQDISKVPVDQVLSKFNRYEYPLEDAAELIARLENTTDYGYMKRVARETLKQAVELTGELSGRIVNGEYSIKHDDLKVFSKKKKWRFGDDENEQQSEPQPATKIITKNKNEIDNQAQELHENSKEAYEDILAGAYYFMEKMIQGKINERAVKKLIKNTTGEITPNGLGDYLTQHYGAAKTAGKIFSNALKAVQKRRQ